MLYYTLMGAYDTVTVQSHVFPPVFPIAQARKPQRSPATPSEFCLDGALERAAELLHEILEKEGLLNGSEHIYRRRSSL